MEGLIGIQIRLRKQAAQAMQPVARVTCRGAHPDNPEWTDDDDCGKTLPIWMMFRCLYCGFYFCQSCAEKHFGKTRAQNNLEAIADGRYFGGGMGAPP
jgi:hypothetical protein